VFWIEKSLDSTHNWEIYDRGRNPFNPVTNSLKPNTSDVENVGYPGTSDFTATGIKLREDNSTSNFNQSGVTYVYMTIGQPNTR
jgi:hypothetical protein